VAALIALANVLPPYGAQLMAQILILGLFAMSLDLLIGYTGLPSLGHAAYFGVAAYVAAILSLRFAMPFAVAALAGLVATVVTAGLFHLVALRTAKAYYLMISLAFSQVLWSVAVSWTGITGGDNGLPNVPRPAGLGSKGYLDAVVVIFVLCAIALYVFVRSPLGYALRGIRENEGRMSALGYNVWNYKYAAALAAALFAGVAGELSMYLDSFVGPSALSVALSAQVLMMTLVGAAGTLFGPFVGAIVFVFLQHVLSTYTARWMLIMGLVYVAVALYAPDGIFGLLRRRPAALAQPNSE